jgi:ferritin-like metal-binding protein YciE
MAKQPTRATNGSNVSSSSSSSSGSNTQSNSSSSASASKEEKKPEKTLEDLFETNLQDIYSAEQQLIEALPKLAKAAYNEDLQDAFNRHLEQTKRQAERLDKIFQRLRITKGKEKCKAMEGLIEESDKIIAEFDESPVRDSALIIGAQKVEHYEIAAYGSLCELADVLGFTKIGDVLDRSLEEEENTDRTLTSIAMDVNDEAYEISQEEAGSYADIE